MICQHCTTTLNMTREVEDNTQGTVTLRDYLCPKCGSRVSTRQPKRQPESVLFVAEPSADTKQRETAQREREAAGHEAFLSAGGRRHVR